MKIRTVLLWATISTLACSSGASGTYSDAAGSMLLELRSGGKATFTFQGNATQCGYSTGNKNVTLDCPGPAGKTVFMIHDDGSLTGPDGSFIPALLRKTK